MFLHVFLYDNEYLLPLQIHWKKISEMFSYIPLLNSLKSTSLTRHYVSMLTYIMSNTNTTHSDFINMHIVFFCPCHCEIGAALSLIRKTWGAFTLENLSCMWMSLWHFYIVSEKNKDSSLMFEQRETFRPNEQGGQWWRAACFCFSAALIGGCGYITQPLFSIFRMSKYSPALSPGNSHQKLHFDEESITTDW